MSFPQPDLLLTIVCRIPIANHFFLLFKFYLFLTKEARIYNGAKTASSINGAGKTGHVKDEKFLRREGHPERFTALHGEEKREEGVSGDPNEMRWNQ